MAQLRQICRDQIMEEVLWSINPGHRPASAHERGPPEPHGAAAYKVLVLDGFATRIISSCCKMSDITDAGVSHVENLAVRRQPLPMLEAIYFVAPTSESVAAIGRDFQGRRKPQYARAHIVFTGHLPDALLQQISQNRNLCSRIAALKELNMEFLAVEDAVFSVEMKNAFYDLHAVPAPAGKAAIQAKMAQRLASLCVTLGSQHGDLPLIRYDRASVVASEVASALERELRRFRDTDRDMSARLLQTNAERHSTGTRPTVLVLDRARDIATPLVHELTYQAMCQDLLEISDSGIVQRDARTAGAGEQHKPDVLSDDDTLWSKYKHKHIGEVLGEIPREFEEFQASSGVADFQKLKAGGRSADLKDMTRVVKELPRYTKKQEKFSMHIGLAQKVSDIYQQRKLEDICTLEMDMLFGEDSTGSSVLGTMLRGDTLREDVVRVLRDASEPDRARLLAMLHVTQPQMATELLESGELLAYPSDHAAAESTVKRLAGEPADGRYATRGWRTDKHDFPGYSKGDKVMDNTSRYKPALYWTANDLIDPAKGLDSSAFPYCGEDPGPSEPAFMQGSASHRSGGAKAGPNRGWRGTGGGRRAPGPRLIIFVTGGISYSECRTAYELAAKFPGVQVLIGSTELLTPERALQRYRCSPPTPEDLDYETGTLEGGARGGAGSEPSALDACIDKIPLEKIFPCCFGSEIETNSSPLLSGRWQSQSDAEDRPLVMNP